MGRHVDPNVRANNFANLIALSPRSPSGRGVCRRSHSSPARKSIAAFFVVAACLGGTSSRELLQAQDEGKAVVRERIDLASGKKRMAILIGVQNYQRLRSLNYCHNDVKLLEETLREYSGFDDVIVMTENAEKPRFRPTRSNIISELDAWLKVANTGQYDRVLIYFSGHGFRDGKGKLYFAPPDCNRAQMELTGMPMSWVRDTLDACTRVPVKMLILDTCHAGEGRGDGAGITGNDTLAFTKAHGLLTIASCSSDEVSQEWEDKKHGLFTYFLCRGLQGQADADGDRMIHTGELYPYVFSQVLRQSTEMGREQNVVQRPSNDWRGVAVVSRVRHVVRRPESLPPVNAVETLTLVNGAVEGGAKLYLRFGDGAKKQVVLERGQQHQFAVELTTNGLAKNGIYYFTGDSSLGQDGWKPLPSIKNHEFIIDRLGSTNLWRPIPVLYDRVGLKLVRIPAGSFRMGSGETSLSVGRAFNEPESIFRDETPQRKVRISKPFYMGAHEVTWADFSRFVAETEYVTDAERDGRGGTGFNPKEGETDKDNRRAESWRSPGHERYAVSHPVVLVSYRDATAYCRWLSQKHGATYRLPTEAEWEYAARAGTMTRFFSGNDVSSLHGVANVPDRDFLDDYNRRNPRSTLNYATLSTRDGYIDTAPVGSFRPNRFGLFDVHGNVWEWCRDSYDAQAYRRNGAMDPFVANSTDLYVIRGGCYM